MILRTLFPVVFALVIGCAETNSETADFEGNIRGGLASGQITLTFDDGPTVHTGKILDSLAKYNLKATFFVTGKNAKRYPRIMRRMRDEGHLVANHTVNHPRMTELSRAQIIKEVEYTHMIIKPYVNDNAYFFRAPYGAWQYWVGDILNAAGLDFYVGNIHWDIGGTLTSRYSADWNCWSKKISVYECGQGYLNEIQDRRSGVVLFHDITSSTARMIEYLLPKILDRGFSVVRLDTVPLYKNKM